MTDTKENEGFEDFIEFMNNPLDQLIGILHGSDNLEHDCKLFVTRNQDKLIEALQQQAEKDRVMELMAEALEIAKRNCIYPQMEKPFIEALAEYKKIKGDE